MEIKIVDFEQKYTHAFSSLNKAWITKYFEIEPKDLEVLDNPQKYILEKGGHILVALADDKPVGVCCLLLAQAHVFELGKMAVDENHQSKGIGYKLGQAAIKLAKDLAAKSIFLETNTSLKPAINVYEKLGFKGVAFSEVSPYKRADYKMEILF